jgi:hypothetical protein
MNLIVLLVNIGPGWKGFPRDKRSSLVGPCVVDIEKSLINEHGDQARKAFPGTNAIAYLSPASLTKKNLYK